jgi:predicted lipoprotein with Yx(FWY)xxD motif
MMRLSRRFLPVALALAALSVPVVVFAQDMGPFATQNTGLGTILTDGAGRTVYIWHGDTQGSGTSNCADACANAWPPYTVDEGMAMGMMGGMSMDEMMMNMTGPGVIQRADGTYQATWNGWPTYYFQRDAAPGDTNGQGSNGFGAMWEVVQPQM